MKIVDVEKWLETDEGKEWLEGKKQPLIDKRNQLLDEISSLKNRLTDESEKSNAQNAKIKGYLENLKNKHCFDCFNDYDTFKSVLIDDKELKQFVLEKITKLAEVDGGLIADIDDNGNFKYATSQGKEFKDYYKEWLSTESAKSFIYNPSTGGGARGNYSKSVDNIYSKEALKKMSPEQIAENLNNPAFRNSLNSNT